MELIYTLQMSFQDRKANVMKDKMRLDETMNLQMKSIKGGLILKSRDAFP